MMATDAWACRDRDELKNDLCRYVTSKCQEETKRRTKNEAETHDREQELCHGETEVQYITAVGQKGTDEPKTDVDLCDEG